MNNCKIRFWSRRLFLTRWTVLKLVHHQVLCSGLHIICGFCGPALTLGPDTFADLPARKTFMVKCEAGKRELRTNRRAVFLQPLFYFVQPGPESTFPCQGKYDRVCKVCIHAGKHVCVCVSVRACACACMCDTHFL